MCGKEHPVSWQATSDSHPDCRWCTRFDTMESELDFVICIRVSSAHGCGKEPNPQPVIPSKVGIQEPEECKNDVPRLSAARNRMSSDKIRWLACLASLLIAMPLAADW